jgi:hypothetical protein
MKSLNENEVSIDNWFRKKISFSRGTGAIIIILTALCLFVIDATVKQTSNGYDGKDTTGLEIESLIRNVKSELIKADSERIAKNEGALFKLRDFEMEISFTVRKVNRAGTKFDYKFVTVEGGTETGNEKVQKLILHWDAVPEYADTVFSPNDSSGNMIVKQIVKPKAP